MELVLPTEAVLHRCWRKGEFLIQTLGKTQLLMGGIYPGGALGWKGHFPPAIALQPPEEAETWDGPGCKGLRVLPPSQPCAFGVTSGRAGARRCGVPGRGRTWRDGGSRRQRPWRPLGFHDGCAAKDLQPEPLAGPVLQQEGRSSPPWGQDPARPALAVRPERRLAPGPCGGAAFAPGCPLHPAVHMGEPQPTPPARPWGADPTQGTQGRRRFLLQPISQAPRGAPLPPACARVLLGTLPGGWDGDGDRVLPPEEGVWGLSYPILHSQLDSDPRRGMALLTWRH